MESYRRDLLGFREGQRLKLIWMAIFWMFWPVQDKLAGSIQTSAPMTFGRISPDVDPLRQSAYQDFRFYSRELSPDEIARLPFEDYVSEIVQKPPSIWSDDQFNVVSDFYFAQRDEATDL